MKIVSLFLAILPFRYIQQLSTEDFFYKTFLFKCKRASPNFINAKVSVIRYINKLCLYIEDEDIGVHNIFS